MKSKSLFDQLKGAGLVAIVAALLQLVVPMTPTVRASVWVAIAALCVLQVFKLETSWLTPTRRFLVSAGMLLVVAIAAYSWWPAEPQALVPKYSSIQTVQVGEGIPLREFDQRTRINLDNVATLVVYRFVEFDGFPPANAPDPNLSHVRVVVTRGAISTTVAPPQSESVPLPPPSVAVVPVERELIFDQTGSYQSHAIVADGRKFKVSLLSTRSEVGAPEVGKWVYTYTFGIAEQ